MSLYDYNDFCLPEITDSLKYFAETSRAFLRQQAWLYLYEVYEQYVEKRILDKDGHGWREMCNRATSEYHLAQLLRDKTLVEETDKDIYRGPISYDGTFLDSVLFPEFPAQQLGAACRKRADDATKFRPSFFVWSEDAALFDHYYSYGGRSEFRTSLRVATSVRISFRNSKHPFYRQLANNWRHLPLPTPSLFGSSANDEIERFEANTRAAYIDEFPGNAVSEVDGEEIVIVCPWIPDFFKGESAIANFLERLTERLKDQRFFLCINRGFNYLKKGAKR